MEDKSHSIFAVACTFLAISWIIVVLRCYVRLTLTRWGVDDLTMVVTLLLFSTFVSSLIFSTTNGLGKHDKAITNRITVMNAFKGFFLCDLFYILSSGIVKISFCLSLLRVVVIGRAYVYTIYTVAAVTGIFTTFYWFFTLFTCWPVDFLWEQIRNPDGQGTCRHFRAVISGSYAHGSIVCLGDITLAIVPALILRKLSMNSRTKISAMVLLGFGAIASVATVARITYIHHGYDQLDFLYTNAEIMIWSTVEIGVSIIAVSAVTLKPLMMKYTIFFHTRSNNSGSPEPPRHIENFTFGISTLPQSNTHDNRTHQSSGPTKISSSILRSNTIIGNGRSSSEENIWASKGGGHHSINTSEEIEEEFELVSRGKVEFSTSMATKEHDDDPMQINQQVFTEQRPYANGR
ncbi:integral membrane protein [Histoplasma ohiense]|nr:integral membrane protein [Histoplasma ohiense (nom. inval.)]